MSRKHLLALAGLLAPLRPMYELVSAWSNVEFLIAKAPLLENWGRLLPILDIASLAGVGLLVWQCVVSMREAEGRTLVKRQRAALIRELSARPREAIALDSITGDVEALRFARQLAGAFAEAGWHVTPPNGTTRLTSTRVGLVLFAAETHEEVASFLDRVFAQVGLACVRVQAKQESLKIVVAAREPR